tara:strand:+ start:187 stop:705 length:519 start_codon:yes stop_codon:yes gene_type:complete
MSETKNIIEKMVETTQLDPNFLRNWRLAKEITQTTQSSLEDHLTVYTLQTAEKATVERFQTRDDSYTPFLNIVLWEGKPEILEFLPDKLNLEEWMEIERQDLAVIVMPWEEEEIQKRRLDLTSVLPFRDCWCKCKTCLRLNRTCATCTAKINKLKQAYKTEYGRMKKAIDRC